MGDNLGPLSDHFAVIAPRFSGFTSAVASSCIIYLIARSKVKLSSIYHRIMFGMSIADVIGSVAMGLTTLPMLNDWYRNEIYNTAGARFGNKQTCQAQGFFFVAGVTVMYGYNFSLCIYYACAIALRLNENFIAKYLEPFFHLIPLALGLTSAIIPLVADMYHPTPWEAWCTVVTSNNPHQRKKRCNRDINFHNFFTKLGDNCLHHDHMESDGDRKNIEVVIS